MALARFSTTFASLLSAGVPVIEALDIVAANSGNQVVANALVGAQEGVREGKSLSGTLSQYPVMPTMVTQMIETGEESGALDEMLDKVATFYDNEVNATVDSLTSILEPLIILFMGACIGAIVISLYLPDVRLREAGAEASISETSHPCPSPRQRGAGFSIAARGVQVSRSGLGRPIEKTCTSCAYLPSSFVEALSGQEGQPVACFWKFATDLVHSHRQEQSDGYATRECRNQ